MFDEFDGTTVVLPTGSVLFHGTTADFDEACESLEGPSWLSTSKEVAQKMAKMRPEGGGEPRVLVYELVEDAVLPGIYSRTELGRLADTFGLDLHDTEAMRDSLQASSLPGWHIPHNYPTGSDTLIKDTDMLRYLYTELA